MKFGMSHLAEDGVLATAEHARQARTALERAIADQPAGAPVELDFAGITAVTVTFVDECLGRFLGSRLAGFDADHPIFATHANQAVRETLAAALRARRLSLLSFSDNGVELLGADQTLEDTIRLAMTLESFTVNELAGQLGLTAQAANNRLVQLVRLGALTRARVLPSRGGREFRYAVPRDVARRTRARSRRAPAPA